MSSNELSGASAEATATNPALTAESTFGSTRGSGLARGKGKRSSAPAASTAASTPYTPTAIEVVTAPREYQNPFAPVETPAAVTPEPVPAVAPAPAAYVPPVRSERIEPVAPVKEYSAPAPIQPPATAATEADEQAELNILPPEQPKSTPAQTWESEGFRPARESRNDRPRREEAPRREESARREEPRAERAPFDPSTIPAKFLYVRPGYNYVPTLSNYGGAPRERENGSVAYVASSAKSPASPAVETPKASGGFFGWLKSLFGGSPAAPAPVEVRSSEQRQGDRPQGGRNRSQGGGDSQRRRSRGGRGRNQRSGEYRSGGNDQGPSAT